MIKNNKIASTWATKHLGHVFNRDRKQNVVKKTNNHHMMLYAIHDTCLYLDVQRVNDNGLTIFVGVYEKIPNRRQLSFQVRVGLHVGSN